MDRDLLGNPLRQSAQPPRVMEREARFDADFDAKYEPSESRYINVALVAATARRHAEEVLRDAEHGGDIEHSARLRQIDLDRLTAGMSDDDYREFMGIYDREMRKFVFAVRDRIDGIELKMEREQTFWIVLGLVLLFLMGWGLKFWLGFAMTN